MYEQLENSLSRAREHVLPLLTAENLAGVLAVAGPAYILTTHWDSLWLRLLMLIVAGVVGLRLTHAVEGVPRYRRAMVRVKGWVRRHAQGATLDPAQFAARATVGPLVRDPDALVRERVMSDGRF